MVVNNELEILPGGTEENHENFSQDRYESVSKSFRTESITKKRRQQKLVEKQHKGLWRQNSQY